MKLTILSPHYYTRPPLNHLSQSTLRIAASLFPELDAHRTPIKSTFAGLEHMFAPALSINPVPAQDIYSEEDMLLIAMGLRIFSDKVGTTIRWDKVRESIPEIDQAARTRADEVIALASDCNNTLISDLAVTVHTLNQEDFDLPSEVYDQDTFSTWLDVSEKEYARWVRRHLLMSFMHCVTSGGRMLNEIAVLLDIAVRCRMYFSGVRAGLAARIIPDGTEERLLTLSPLALMQIEEIRNTMAIGGTTAARGPIVYKDVKSFFRHSKHYQAKCNLFSTSSTDKFAMMVDYKGNLDVKLSRVDGVRAKRRSMLSSTARVSGVSRQELIDAAFAIVQAHRGALMALIPPAASQNGTIYDSFWAGVPTLPSPSRATPEVLSIRVDHEASPQEDLALLVHPEYIDFSPLAMVHRLEPVVGLHSIYKKIKPYDSDSCMLQGLTLGTGARPEALLHGLSPYMMGLRNLLSEPYEIGLLLAAISGVALADAESFQEVLDIENIENLSSTPHPMVKKLTKKMVGAIVRTNWSDLTTRMAKRTGLLDPGVPGPWGLPVSWWEQHMDLMRSVEIFDLKFYIPKVIVIWGSSYFNAPVTKFEPMDRCPTWFRNPELKGESVRASSHPMFDIVKDLDGGVITSNSALDNAKGYASERIKVGVNMKPQDIMIIRLTDDDLTVGARTLYFDADVKTVAVEVQPDQALEMGTVKDQLGSADITPLGPIVDLIGMYSPGMRPALTQLKTSPEQLQTDVFNKTVSTFYPYDMPNFDLVAGPFEVEGTIPIKTGVSLRELWVGFNHNSSQGSKKGNDAEPKDTYKPAIDPPKINEAPELDESSKDKDKEKDKNFKNKKLTDLI